jgi:RNA polymerase sigma-70 factor (ECF subfamily)
MDQLPATDELLQRLAADPQAVLAAAFTEHQQRLEWIVGLRLDRRLGGRVDVDDVLQETYLQSLQRVAHYLADPSVTLFVWLRSITCQTLIDVHRRHLGYQIRDASREVSLHGGFACESASICLADILAGSSTSPSGVAVRDETAAQIEAALTQLDPIDREVLVMRHFEDLTNSEVAQTLGLQPSAASMRYARALKRLKHVLEPEAPDPGASASLDAEETF